jgi:hypothetical protein
MKKYLHCQRNQCHHFGCLELSVLLPHCSFVAYLEISPAPPSFLLACGVLVASHSEAFSTVLWWLDDFVPCSPPAQVKLRPVTHRKRCGLA